MMLTFFVACGDDVITTSDPAATSSVGTSKNPSSTTDDPVATTKDPAVTTRTPDTDKTPGTNTPGTSANDLLDGLPEEMPVIRIDTNDVPITSKEYYIDGTFTVENTEEAYAMFEEVIEIRGRGNFSWIDVVGKKSYRVKFAEKVNLLGQGYGPARSWTFLAVQCDQSLLRNAAAFKLARSLSGIDYTSSVRFCKLYLNGEYQGVYQVSEQMQVQEYRINVDDTGDNYETGFLVEIDKQAFANGEVAITDGFNTYAVKSDIWAEEQLDFIETYLSDAFYAVLGGQKSDVESMIDLDSVVDTYIVEEVFKNLDVGWGSFYMYRDIGGKLHFGPVWDFDLAAGNADANDMNPFFPQPQYLYVGSEYHDYSQQHLWFIELMQYDWFVELVEARWAEITEELEAIPAYVRAVAELYSEEFDENFEKWPIFGQKINREPAAVQALKSHDEHAEYLAKWLEARIAWLNDYFAGKVEADPPEPGQFEGSGGEGTKESPYRISTAADFFSFTQAMFYGETFDNVYFLQTADIDMKGYNGYNGIGAAGTFNGVYDGNGYRINAEIQSEDGCIFPYVNGIVMNVVTTGSVNNSAQAAGIARSVRRQGAILNCISFMSVTSTWQNAGGIVSSNQNGGGTIAGCVFAGSLNGAEASGAINIFMDERGGSFSYNYYLDTAKGSSVGNETAFTAQEAAALHTTLNANLSRVAATVRGVTLCKWAAGDDGMPIMEHQ